MVILRHWNPSKYGYYIGHNSKITPKSPKGDLPRSAGPPLGEGGLFETVRKPMFVALKHRFLLQTDFSRMSVTNRLEIALPYPNKILNNKKIISTLSDV